MKLDSGEIAQIVSINSLYPELPVVKTDNDYLDLSDESGLSIKNLIKDVDKAKKFKSKIISIS